mmetsp:Transcript_85035/g.245593  ORF Transcript_85035/g.245593 Transcript_85035/m.245593 type:complete len:158 (+) Transcript_85035:69-542(+)
MAWFGYWGGAGPAAGGGQLQIQGGYPGAQMQMGGLYQGMAQMQRGLQQGAMQMQQNAARFQQDMGNMQMQVQRQVAQAQNQPGVRASGWGTSWGFSSGPGMQSMSASGGGAISTSVVNGNVYVNGQLVASLPPGTPVRTQTLGDRVLVNGQQVWPRQ